MLLKVPVKIILCYFRSLWVAHPPFLEFHNGLMYQDVYGLK